MSERLSQLRDTLQRLWASHRFPEFVWLVVVFAVLGFYKYSHASHKASFEIDGGYYADVARHVRDGLGVTTNVSLYHQAYSYFPHETSVSPLWPLLYGYASRVGDILKVGIWLPAVLYMTALLFGFLWANRQFPGSLFPRVMRGFTAGHVFVLMLGLHREFFIFTSVPYTEGLAYTLLALCLWRFIVIWPELNVWRGLEMGAWLGVLLLVRAQLLLVAIAAFMTLGWAVIALPSRRRYAAALLTCAAVFGAIVGGYYLLFLDGFIGNGPWAALMRFDQGWETAALSTFDPMVKTHGLVELLKDRADGIEIAFKRAGKYSYARSFYTFYLAVPFAVPFVVAAGLRERKRWDELWRWLRTEEALAPLMVLLFALGGFVSMHLVHKDYFSEWHFARRQGLTAVFLFFVALVFLLKERKLAVVVGVFLLCSGTYLGWNAVDKELHRVEKAKERGPETYRTSLVKWLERQGKVTVAMSAHEPQKLALMTPNTGYQWFYRRTTFEDLEVMTTKLGAKYVIMHGKANRWPLRRDKRFAKTYKRVTSAGGMTIYERK